MVVCCIGSEYLPAEAASPDPSSMGAIFSFLLLCHLLNECVGSRHLFFIPLPTPFPILVSYLLRHALANPHSPYPSLKLGMEDNGAVMHMEMHRYPFKFPSFVFVEFSGFIDLAGS